MELVLRHLDDALGYLKNIALLVVEPHTVRDATLSELYATVSRSVRELKTSSRAELLEQFHDRVEYLQNEVGNLYHEISRRDDYVEYLENQLSIKKAEIKFCNDEKKRLEEEQRIVQEVQPHLNADLIESLDENITNLETAVQSLDSSVQSITSDHSNPDEDIISNNVAVSDATDTLLQELREMRGRFVLQELQFTQKEKTKYVPEIQRQKEQIVQLQKEVSVLKKASSQDVVKQLQELQEHHNTMFLKLKNLDVADPLAPIRNVRVIGLELKSTKAEIKEKTALVNSTVKDQDTYLKKKRIGSKTPSNMKTLKTRLITIQNAEDVVKEIKQQLKTEENISRFETITGAALDVSNACISLLLRKDADEIFNSVWNRGEVEFSTSFSKEDAERLGVLDTELARLKADLKKLDGELNTLQQELELTHEYLSHKQKNEIAVKEWFNDVGKVVQSKIFSAIRVKFTESVTRPNGQVVEVNTTIDEYRLWSLYENYNVYNFLYNKHSELNRERQAKALLQTNFDSTKELENWRKERGYNYKQMLNDTTRTGGAGLTMYECCVVHMFTYANHWTMVKMDKYGKFNNWADDVSKEDRARFESTNVRLAILGAIATNSALESGMRNSIAALVGTLDTLTAAAVYYNAKKHNLMFSSVHESPKPILSLFKPDVLKSFVLKYERGSVCGLGVGDDPHDYQELDMVPEPDWAELPTN